MRERTFVCALLVFLPLTVEGQRCLGSADFDGGRFRVGAATKSNSEASQVALTVATGEGGGQFLDGFYGRATLAAVPMTINTWGVRTGSQIDFGGVAQLQLCPYAAIVNSEGSYIPSGGTKQGSKSQSYALGAALGMLAFTSEEVSVRPTLGAELRFASAAGSVAYEGIGGATRISSTNYIGVTLGIGVVVHNGLSVTPTFFIPVGLKAGTNAVGFAASWNFDF
jgi:hypothetical protein